MTMTWTAVPRCWTLFAVFLLAAAAAEDPITVSSGQTVTLPCQGPVDKTIKFVRWSRPDLTGYVLFFRDEQLDPEDQDPSFLNRVDLLDRQMKNGDVSLVVKNVTTADTGTYLCEVFTDSWKVINTINLSVTKGDDHGRVGLTVGLSVSAVALVVAAVAGFFIYRKVNKQGPL